MFKGFIDWVLLSKTEFNQKELCPVSWLWLQSLSEMRAAGQDLLGGSQVAWSRSFSFVMNLFPYPFHLLFKSSLHRPVSWWYQRVGSSSLLLQSGGKACEDLIVAPGITTLGEADYTSSLSVWGMMAWSINFRIHYKCLDIWQKWSIAVETLGPLINKLNGDMFKIY